MLKYAKADVLEVRRASGSRMQKQGHRATFEYEPRDGYVYVRSRMISSRVNDNFDGFPAEEIRKGWQTFVGKPVFVNHHNEDHRKARGFILDAALHEDTNPDGTPDVWVEGLMEVDAVTYPKLAKALLAGEIDRTSMGVDVAFSKCSFCGNKASTPLDYCKHIPAMKGQRIERTTASGEKQSVLVYEDCYGLHFFENSLLVEDPADPTAHFLGVDDRGVGGGYRGELKTASRRTARPSPATTVEDIERGLGNRLEGHATYTVVVNGREVYRGADRNMAIAVGRMHARSTGHVVVHRDVPGDVFDNETVVMGQRRKVSVIHRDRPDDAYLLARREADRLARTAYQRGDGWGRQVQRGAPDPHTIRDVRGHEVYYYHGEDGSVAVAQIDGEEFWWDAYADSDTVMAEILDDLGKTGSRRRALDERRAPAQVDTIRDAECPVCGESSAYDNGGCSVCGYEASPAEFGDPDLTRAQDLRNGDDGTADPTTYGEHTTPEERLVREHPDDPLTDPNRAAPSNHEGEPAAIEQAEQMADFETAEDVEGVDPEAPVTDVEEALATPAPEDEALLSEVKEILDTVKQQMAPEDMAPSVRDDVREGIDELREMLSEVSEDLGDEADEDEQDPDEESDEQDPEDEDDSDDDDDLPPFKTKTSRRTVRARRSPRQGVSTIEEPTVSKTSKTKQPTSLQMLAKAAQVIEEQQARIARQDRALAMQARRQQVQARQIAYIGKAAGLDRPLRMIADGGNPAQPIDDPAAESATGSTEEARGNPQGGLEEQGAVPGTTDVGSTTVDVEEVGGITGGDNLGNAAPDDRVDPTKPVAGTEGPRPINEVKTETDVRVKDGVQGETMFGIEDAFSERVTTTSSKDEEGAPRLIASMRLARARIAAGITSGTDDLALGSSIAKDASLSDDAIRHEIQTLESVSRAASRTAPTESQRRRLVPRQASGPSVPSLASAASLTQAAATPSRAPSDDEFLW